MRVAVLRCLVAVGGVLVGGAGFDAARADTIHWAQTLGDRIIRADISGDYAQSVLEWPQSKAPIAIAVDEVGNKVYWAQNFGVASEILRADLNGNNVDPIAGWPLLDDPVSIALDPAANKLYWAQSSGVGGGILRGDLDGHNIERLVDWPLLNGPVAVALDPAGGKIYWAQSSGIAGGILRADLDGSNVETLVEWPLLNDPVAIALDPAGGRMYWAQSSGIGSAILRADLSGSNVQTLVGWPLLVDPVAIALDPARGRMYWAQSTGVESGIIRADLNGDNLETVLGWPNVEDPLAIGLYLSPSSCTADVECSDWFYCNGAETCSASACQAGTPPNCDDGVNCTADLCDGSAGACMHTPDDALCDDGVACTVDSCNESAGACTHTADDGLCGNSLFCDGIETCDEVAGCQPGTSPNCDDGVNCTVDSCNESASACTHTADDGLCDNGLFCDGDEYCDVFLGCKTGAVPCPERSCDEDNDMCGPILCPAPAAVGSGSRYLAVTPASGGDPVAILISGQTDDSTVSCVSLYAQAPQRACVGGQAHRSPCTGQIDCPEGTCVTSATLGPVPVRRTPDQWLTVQIYSATIRPSAAYDAQVECGSSGEAILSTPVRAVTWLWGDANHSATCADSDNTGEPCDRDADCPGGACLGVNFTDISVLVDGFKAIFSTELTLQSTDLTGSDCQPNRIISFTDIGAVVDAFKQIAFPCPAPCKP